MINVVATDGGIENFHNGGHPNKRGHGLFLAQFEHGAATVRLQLSQSHLRPTPRQSLIGPRRSLTRHPGQNVDDWVTPVSDLRALDYRLKPINNNQILLGQTTSSAQRHSLHRVPP